MEGTASVSTGAAASTGATSQGGGSESSGQASSGFDSSSQQGSQTSEGQQLFGQEGQAQAGEASTSEASGLVEVKVGSRVLKLSAEDAALVKGMEKSMQAKAREAAQARKEFEAERRFRESLKQNPWESLEKEGLDKDSLDRLAEERLQKKIELMEMSPEQRRIMELEAKVAADEATREEQRSLAVARARQIEETRALQSYDQQIGEAFKASGLPVSDPYAVGLIAAKMQQSIRAAKAGKIERPLTAVEAAEKIKGVYRTSVQKFLGSLDPQGIHELLGETSLKALREFDVSKLRSGGALQFGSSDPASKGPATPAASRDQNKPLTQEEWDARYRR